MPTDSENRKTGPGAGKAPEAGEPQESQRRGGRIVDEKGTPEASRPSDDRKSLEGKQEHLESGRHRAE
jgi:hypothetical protein